MFKGNNNSIMDKRKNKKSRRFKLFVYFIMFELFFSVATSPFIVYYGPFNTLKKMVVGAAMSSFKHQYLATLFLSNSQIEKIRNGDISTVPAYVNSSDNSTQQQDLNNINTNLNDNSIELKKIQGKKFSGLMMVVHNPRMLKVGYSKLLGEQGEKTSTIAKEFNSIAAINGGGFTDKAQNSTATWTGTGALPIGIVMAAGNVIYPKEIADPNKKIAGDLVGITKNGVLIVGKYSLNELRKNQVTDAMTFGPILILDGITKNREDGVNIDNQGPAPRTAIGQRKEDGAILLLVIDGRQGLQIGATIKDVQDIMKQENAFNAINLDGGASTTMYYDGKVLNNPSGKFGERPIPTIFYVKK
ncbi:phosphodiester glycosidase family protein [Clostridium tagluense]|uniref:phosphodiester glycosidase family protein n=1 Tax=Clostridium TaxID=1485 RepID=UPI001CCE7397|nr:MULTISPECIES: phosphodiester glycosidase family protein [Clostridium]MBZ9623400.1 phosphodiester glycosidase family protein [Clostridium sp. FP2]MCB2310949.1 phosphodiester glycosidase family protein [Clostridium tagluense]MCB2315803.1 phosphodiester glycosidase family protein [Clostridium tagluense]MCB2320553.1 phosphodiester glycosidase family protein [Clostridium tagluense]MCB2325542.1 phosphodiester glycosidase family protein [Clostridium tagluense]